MDPNHFYHFCRADRGCFYSPQFEDLHHKTYLSVRRVQFAGEALMSDSRIGKVFLDGFPVLLGFILVAFSLALLDTIHFTKRFPTHLFDLIWTPYNSLRFNLSRDNLAAHGIHPRWMHIIVNWPLLFGIGLYGVVDICSPQRSIKSSDRFEQLGEYVPQFVVGIDVSQCIWPRLWCRRYYCRFNLIKNQDSYSP